MLAQMSLWSQGLVTEHDGKDENLFVGEDRGAFL